MVIPTRGFASCAAAVGVNDGRRGSNPQTDSQTRRPRSGPRPGEQRPIRGTQSVRIDGAHQPNEEPEGQSD